MYCVACILVQLSASLVFIRWSLEWGAESFQHCYKILAQICKIFYTDPNPRVRILTLQNRIWTLIFQRLLDTVFNTRYYGCVWCRIEEKSGSVKIITNPKSPKGRISIDPDPGNCYKAIVMDSPVYAIGWRTKFPVSILL
jgi:hypothetical protein